MKYKIIDLQGMGTHQDEIHNSTEEVRQHLLSFHSVDYEGEYPLEQFSLNDILEYGQWDIEVV